MCNPPFNYRSSSLSLRSVFRLASQFCRPLVVISLGIVTLGLLGPAANAQNIFDCSAWTTSTGACQAFFSGQSATSNSFFVSTASPPSGIVGGAIDLVPAGSTHLGYSVIYQTAVNVQAFSTTFTFVPNGYNFAFVVENANNNGSPRGFAAGAGGEGGFSQFAGPPSNIAPNYVFALEFDSGGMNCQTCGYTNGGVQWYQTLQNPALPGDANPGYLPIYPTNKVSVSSPFSFTTGTQYIPTGHTYGAKVTYNGSDLTLNMWDVTAGGSCPGASCFTTSWSGVYIPAIVGATTAYVGFTAGVGLTTSDPLYANSFSYTVNTPTEPSGASFATWNAGSTYNNGTVSASSPVFSVAPGSYAGTQSVSMTTSSGAYICYLTSTSIPALLPMTDNNGGCSAGTLYTGPVSIASSTTLYAIAGSSNAAYPKGTLSPAGLGPPSTVVSGTYTIGGGTPQASAPTFSPVAGTYTGAQNVTLSTASSGAVICYNTTGSPATNGSTGCTAGTLYSGPVSVSSSETLYAVAGGTGYNDSSVGNAGYVIQASGATPSFSPGAGTYSSAQSVTLSDATPGATIYYTTNGTTPTTSSTVYTGPITVSSTETLKAIAVATGDTNSAVASATYTINVPVVATPAFSPAAGTYSSAQSVTLSDATSGATIYYTTNGTTPTTSSTQYTGPITVSSTETLQAIAAATGDTNSAVASATYTINAPVVATPTFSPAAGTYSSAQSVTLSDATSGATIYYTTNGTTPTTSSTRYTGPITVSSTETLQAIAAATGDTNSAVASATYTITATWWQRRPSHPPPGPIPLRSR